MKLFGTIFYLLAVIFVWFGVSNMQEGTFSGNQIDGQELQIEQISPEEEPPQELELIEEQEEDEPDEISLPQGAGQPPDPRQDMYMQNVEKGRTSDYDFSATIPVYTGLPEKKYDIVKLGLDLESSLACGKFDIKASLKSIFNKEALSDYLKDTARDVVKSNFLYFLCKASPTLCQVLQHYKNFSALMLQGYSRGCEHLERLAVDMAAVAQSHAQYECVRKELKSKKTLDEALNKCRTSYSDTYGREIDFVKEAFNMAGADLTDPYVAFLKEMIGELKLTTGGKVVIGSDPKIIKKRIETLAKEYYQTFFKIYKAAKEQREVDEKDLAKVSPMGLALSKKFFKELGYLTPEEIDFYFRYWARICALRETAEKVDEAEDRLFQAINARVSRSPVDALKGQIDNLRRQLVRIKELSEFDKTYAQSIDEVLAKIKKRKDLLAEELIEAKFYDIEKDEYINRHPDFGKLPDKRDVDEILKYLEEEIKN